MADLSFLSYEEAGNLEKVIKDIMQKDIAAENEFSGLCMITHELESFVIQCYKDICDEYGI